VNRATTLPGPVFISLVGGITVGGVTGGVTGGVVGGATATAHLALVTLPKSESTVALKLYV
jgi:hypothetical protein